MKNRIIVGIFAIFVLSIMLTGCGNDKKKKEKDTNVAGTYVINKITTENGEEIPKDQYNDIFSGTPSLKMNSDKTAVVEFNNSSTKEKSSYNYTYDATKLYINEYEYDYSYKYDDKVLKLYAKNSMILYFDKK